MGKGLGNQIVAKIVSKAKEEYKLKKLYAGVAVKMLRVKFLNNNFKLEGIRKTSTFK